MENSTAAEFLAREIEDGVGADGGGFGGLALAAGYGDGCDEVLAGDSELEIAEASGGHGGVKDGLTFADAEIEEGDRLL